MNKSELINKAKVIFTKAKIKVDKHSPEILIAVGVVGVATSAVMACKATLKLDEIICDYEATKEAINDTRKTHPDTYSESSAQKDTAILTGQTCGRIAKLYAPAVALGAASIGCIVASNDIHRKRHAYLVAACATAEQNFKDYRKRIVERFGEEVDRQVRFNVKPGEIEETATDENGEIKIERRSADIVEDFDPNSYGPYAKFFDASSPYWEKNPEYNLMFLKQKQCHFNDLLKVNGFVFLNDVLKELGIPVTKAGQKVGWIYDQKNPTGDNYIDFGIYDGHNPAVRDFVNGYEPVILLDFNCDGDIWEKM